LQSQEVSRGAGADGNGDGIVDVCDLQQWHFSFGDEAEAGAGGNTDPGDAPESGSIVLVLLAVASIAPMRRRD
jgi:hypothetical protein